MRQLEDGAFAERLSEKLQTDRQSRARGEPARDADATNSGKVAGDGKNIRKVHLQRIA